MLSRFQIGGEDHTSWIIQTATETMEEVMLCELAAINAGLNNTGIRSRENEGANGAAFEIEFQFGTRLVTTKELISFILASDPAERKKFPSHSSKSPALVRELGLFECDKAALIITSGVQRRL